MIPLPFYVVTESAFDSLDDKFDITPNTIFGTLVGAGTQTRALAVFHTIESARRFSSGKFTRGSFAKIKTTTDSIAFLRDVMEQCNINYLLMEPDHTTSRKGALSITSAIDWLRSTSERN